MKVSSWSNETQVTTGTEVETGAGPFFGAGAKATLKSELSTAFTKSESTEKGETQTYSEKCSIPTNMEKYGIHKIWQYQMTVNILHGSIDMKTCAIACTPDGGPPTYEPGGPDHIGSCSKDWRALR